MSHIDELIDEETGLPIKLKEDAIWYRPFCNQAEIERIMKPKNGKDLILQRRADIIADHVRFTRLYIHKSRLEGWNFEKSFSTRHYDNFLEYLSDDDKIKCHDISFGDMFSDNLNGYAENNKYFGTIIYLNESLRYYLYYMILATFPIDKPEIPDDVKKAAFIIAIRIFLGNEAMDFEMDPRGKIPTELDLYIKQNVEQIMQYIAGHEFSHFLCGHLTNSTSKAFFTNLEGKQYETEVFNTSQQQELEADLNSLSLPEYPEEVYKSQYLSALHWFVFLDIGESAINIINPSPRTYQTHPSAKDRMKNILENANRPQGLDEVDNNLIQYLQKFAEQLKEFLQEDMAVNIEVYEMYGSIYLAEPNTEWRGRELIDRVDY